MVDIQSPAAEIRRGKKDRKIVTTGQKYNGPLFHRAAITRETEKEGQRKRGERVTERQREREFICCEIKPPPHHHNRFTALFPEPPG